jgi:hypothetical protein
MYRLQRFLLCHQCDCSTANLLGVQGFCARAHTRKACCLASVHSLSCSRRCFSGFTKMTCTLACLYFIQRLSVCLCLMQRLSVCLSISASYSVCLSVFAMNCKMTSGNLADHACMQAGIDIVDKSKDWFVCTYACMYAYMHACTCPHKESYPT